MPPGPGAGGGGRRAGRRRARRGAARALPAPAAAAARAARRGRLPGASCPTARSTSGCRRRTATRGRPRATWPSGPASSSRRASSTAPAGRLLPGRRGAARRAHRAGRAPAGVRPYPARNAAPDTGAPYDAVRWPTCSTATRSAPAWDEMIDRRRHRPRALPAAARVDPAQRRPGAAGRRRRAGPRLPQPGRHLRRRRRGAAVPARHRAARHRRRRAGSTIERGRAAAGRDARGVPGRRLRAAAGWSPTASCRAASSPPPSTSTARRTASSRPTACACTSPAST